MSLSIHGIYLFSFVFCVFFFFSRISATTFIGRNQSTMCDAKHVEREKEGKRREREKKKTDEKNLNFYYVRFCIGF